MQTISATELAAWQAAGKDFQLIDVREPFEAEVAEIGGTLIPLATVEQNAGQISREKPVVVHCRSGKRSADAIQRLERMGYTNLYNLAGGILAWSDEVDATVPKY